MKAWRLFPIRFSASPVPRGPRRRQPVLESLEDRVVLSTVHPAIEAPHPLPISGGGTTTGGGGTAISAGTYAANQSSLQTEFDDLFTGATFTTARETQAFNDVVKTVTDSNVTTAELQAIAADLVALGNHPK